MSTCHACFPLKLVEILIWLVLVPKNRASKFHVRVNRSSYEPRKTVNFLVRPQKQASRETETRTQAFIDDTRPYQTIRWPDVIGEEHEHWCEEDHEDTVVYESDRNHRRR